MSAIATDTVRLLLGRVNRVLKSTKAIYNWLCFTMPTSAYGNSIIASVHKNNNVQEDAYPRVNSKQEAGFRWWSKIIISTHSNFWATSGPQLGACSLRRRSNKKNRVDDFPVKAARFLFHSYGAGHC